MAFVTTNADAVYQFSEYNFVRHHEEGDTTLRARATGRAELLDYKFLTTVGGVNFSSAVSFSDRSVSLVYDPTENDGSRVRLLVNNSSYALPLYDWQLKPITLYADSEYTAVASIFGRGPNMERYYYINFHPAFKDTHLGMRMLQADILLIASIVFSEIPKFNGEPILYAGERTEASAAARLISTLGLGNILQTKGTSFTSWVLTDTDRQPTLHFGSISVSVNLQPYYFFWERVDTEQSARYMNLVSQYQELIGQIQPKLDRYRLLEARVMAKVISGPRAESAQREMLALAREIIPLGNEARRIEREIRAFSDSPMPNAIEAEALTDTLRNNQELLDQLAPFVSDAVRVVAQTSALFRGVKQANPEGWRAFHASVVTQVQLRPMETPTRFDKPEARNQPQPGQAR